ncbi:DUF397 domain-containing protein [Streptomyces clavifer]|uniref:DUF397 domain-containing protein n=1 Tax=Streptomyces clavifer TaxID=68188 RepID=UPI00369559A9
MTTSGLAWFRSSYSGTGGDNCVEVAIGAEAVLVRDTKDTRKPPFAVSPGAWSAFTVLAADSRV